MTSKEPFFDDNLITKPHFRLEPAAFKISPSTDYPLMVQAQAPSANKSVRRPSREPYYQGNSWSSRSLSSGSSSYAKLSDIFDYRYLDQLRPGDNEDALVFESDSDYDEESHAENQKHTSIKTDITGSKSGNTRQSSSSRKTFDPSATDSEDEPSELEDYSVHMLTFKVNARAQYTQPPRSTRSMSVSSDNFDERIMRSDLDLPHAGHHPKFTAPKCFKEQTVIDCVLPPPSQDLEGYLEKCSNMLVDYRNERRIPAATHTGACAKDDYSNEAKGFRSVRDDFDVRKPLFML